MVLEKPENKHVIKAFDLTGKVAAVTGGARGIGLEVCRGLAEAGANVCDISRYLRSLSKIRICN
jgi:sorbose reductase